MCVYAKEGGGGRGWKIKERHKLDRGMGNLESTVKLMSVTMDHVFLVAYFT